MSYNWCFHSFDHDKFERALIESRQIIVDEVITEINQFGDYSSDEIAQHEHIGRRILAQGIVYDGLDKADTTIMDRFAFDAFHALDAEIAFTPESSEFLSPYVTADLPSHLVKKHFFSRARPIPESEREYFYLPFFTHLGRRLGQNVPSDCEYVALNPSEVGAIEKELEKFLATDEGRALNATNDENLSRDFLGPVRSALSKGRALHAQVS